MNTSKRTRAVAGPKQHTWAVNQLKADATTIRGRLGFVPEKDEIERLVHDLDRLGINGSEALSHALFAENKLTDPTVRAVAYGRLVERARDDMARRSIDFLAAMREANEFVEITALWNDKRSTETIIRAIGSEQGRGEMRSFVKARVGFANLYVGVQPRDGNKNRDSRPKAEAVPCHRRVMVDIDRGKGADAETDAQWEARRAVVLDTLRPLQPNYVVSSGNGVQIGFSVTATSDRREMNRRVKIFNDETLRKQLAGDPARHKADSVADLTRISRLPFTINVPDASKRKDGRMLSVACPLEEVRDAKIWNPNDLAAAMSGLEPTSNSKTGQVGPATTVLTPSWAKPRTLVRAPSVALAIRILMMIPNDDKGPVDDRKKWIDMLHAFKGATGEDPGAFAAWTDWCAQWGGDPDKDEQAWRDLDPVRIHTGDFEALLGLAQKYNPAGMAAIRDEPELVAYRRERACAAFPDDDLDLGRLDSAAKAVEEIKVSPSAARSPVDKARAVLEASGAKAFQTPDGRAFLSLSGRNFNLASTADRQAIIGRLAQGGINLNKNARAELLDGIESAAYAGAVHEVHVRAARPSNTFPVIYIDLADDAARVVEVTDKGWRILRAEDSPVRFWRPKGMQPLPEPQHDGQGGGFLERLSRHLNIPPIQNPNDPADAGVAARAAILMALAGWTASRGAVPHVLLAGPHGSGKTKAAQRLKGIVDPAIALATSAPKDPETLITVVRTHLVLCIDNLSSISPAISDALSAVATGTALVKRTAYTDADVSSLTARRSVILTAIDPEIVRLGDLSSRVLRIELTALPQRRLEGDLDAEWAADHPAILALFFDMMAGALSRYETVKNAMTGNLPRLADAGLIGEAAAQALGWRPGQLLEAINMAHRQAAEDILTNDPVVIEIEKLIAKNNGSWEGTATDFMNELG